MEVSESAVADRLAAEFDAARANHPARAQLIELPGGEASLEGVRGFYRRLNPGRPLPPGAVAPLEAPSSVRWFGAHALADGPLELLQLTSQLDRSLATLKAADCPEPGYGELTAELERGRPRASAVGAFGVWALPLARAVDRTLGATQLGDGGLLELDGPGPRAWALTLAACLERLAGDDALVMVVHAALRPSAFLEELLCCLAGAPAPIFVVRIDASHEPGATTTASTSGRALSAAQPEYPLAAALAAASQANVFTLPQVRAVAEAIGYGPDPTDALGALAERGVMLRLDADVWAFRDRSTRTAARSVASALFSRSILGAIAHATERIAQDSTDELTLRSLAALESAAAAPSPRPELRWRLALLTARLGDQRRAALVGESVADTPRRRGAVMAWQTLLGDDEAAGWPDASALDAIDHAELALTEAAALARIDPDQADNALERALAPLEAAPPARQEEGNHLAAAAARIALCTGRLDLCRRAMATAGMSPSAQAAAELRDLGELDRTPRALARRLDLAANLHLLARVGSLAPNSGARAYALIEALTLLDRDERLAAASNAESIAAEAGRLLSGRSDRATALAPAVAWGAWAASVQGRTDEALAQLEALIAEQRRTAPFDHPAALLTRAWRARCLRAADRAGEALAELHEVASALRRQPDQAAALWTVRHWRGDCLYDLDRNEEAIAELGAVVAQRRQRLARDHEDVLTAQHRLGAVLANAGRHEQALAQLDTAIEQWGLVGAADSARALTARHSRSVCLIYMDRPADAVGDLDAVIPARVATLSADDPALLQAHADRAFCRLLLEEWEAALGDLTPAIEGRRRSAAADDPALLAMLHQRAVCLSRLGRQPEARAALAELHLAGADLPADHPLRGAAALVEASLNAERAQQ